MQELTVIVSPSTVPCSNSDQQYPVTLQVTVQNASGAAVDLTNSALRFDFSLDPGGSGAASASALLLSNQSGAATEDPVAPLEAITASAVAGTDWSITAAGDGNGASFVAIPNAFTQTSSPGYLMSGYGPTFTFAGILADGVPGVATIVVTVQPEGDVSVIAPGVVTKQADGFGITKFEIDPLAVELNHSAAIQWETSGASSGVLSWAPADGAAVKWNDATVNSPVALGVVAGQPSITTDTAEAELTGRVTFTLTATGPSTTSENLTANVRMAQLAMYPTSGYTVMPGTSFQFNWSVLDGSAAPTLLWAPEDSATVVTGYALGETVPAQGSATAQVSQSTIFTLAVPGEGGGAILMPIIVPPATVVSVEPQPVPPFTAPQPGLGALTVTCVNATGFTVVGPTGTSEYEFDDPQVLVEETMTVLVLDSTRAGTYTITPKGYAPQSWQFQVRTIVSIADFTVSEANVTIGDSCTLEWSAYAASQFVITDDLGTQFPISGGSAASLLIWPTSAGIRTYTLTAEGDTNGGPPPTRTLSITVSRRIKGKEKEKEKESFAGIKGESLRMAEKVLPPSSDNHHPLFQALISQNGQPSAGSGQRRAFIAVDERPGASRTPEPAATSAGGETT